MEIVVGTYQGIISVIKFVNNQLNVVKSFKVSENSIKSICNLGNSHLVMGGFDQQVKVVQLPAYANKIQIKENTGQIFKIVNIDNNKFVIGAQDGTLRLWSKLSWTILNQSKFHKKAISDIIVCENGKLMITSGGNKIIVWAAQKLKKAQQYKFESQLSIQHIRLSQDRKFIYFLTSQSSIYKISTQTNQKTLVLKMPIGHKAQDFVIFDKFIILGTDKGQIMTWQQRYSQNNQNQGAEGLNFQKRIQYKAHNSRIKQIQIINQIYLCVVTASGEVSVWDFIQFLKEVQHISQQYKIQGLMPIAKLQIKGRIICSEVILTQQLKQDTGKEFQKQHGREEKKNKTQNRQQSRQLKVKSKQQKNRKSKTKPINKQKKIKQKIKP